MIAIYINGERADFFGSLTITKDNPLFAKPDTEPTAHTYTLTLPVTATNVKLFSFAQYTLAQPTELLARIEIDGIEILNGTCRVQSIKQDGYSVYFTEVVKGGEGVKAMLSDTRTLRDIISVNEMVDLDGGNGVYVRENGKSAVVGGVGATFYYKEGSNQLRKTTGTPNLAFEVNFLAQRVAQYYGITIAEMPSTYITQLGTRDTFAKSFNGVVTQWIRPTTSIPTLTPKAFLQNVAFALGLRMHMDYKTNTITFASLNEVQKGNKVYLDKFTDISYDATIHGTITYTDIAPYEYEETTEVDGEETKIKHESQYSQDWQYVLGNGEGTFYKNILSIPVADNHGYATFPSMYEDDDERLNNVALVDFVDESGFYYYKPFTPDAYANFEVFNAVNEDNTLVKFKTRMSPLDLVALDMYKTIIVGGCMAYIKSITFNPDAESDITAYLI